MIDNRYLEKTKMLNYDSETLRSLIKKRQWDAADVFHKIQGIYDFVQNEILFGYNRSDLLNAEQVLRDGYGQCNTKATLLMALLRGVGIPCRLHGFEVSKEFQRGATSAFISALAPERIVHTWVEVYYNERWIALEGVITDKKYVEAVKRKCGNPSGEFRGYAIAVKNLAALDVEWHGEDTFVQSEAIVKDYGVFFSPDEFFSEHPQHWSRLKNFMYVNVGRKIMTGNVAKMRRK